MSNNIVLTGLLKSILITIVVMLLLFAFYEFIEISSQDDRIASGETVSSSPGFFDRFFSGGIYSDQHERYINDWVFDAVKFTVSFTFVSLITSFILTVVLFTAAVKVNVRYYSAFRTIILVFHHIPSYVFQLALVAVFCFILEVFPASYSEHNLYSLILPFCALILLFLIHNCFVLIQNLTNDGHSQLNYRLNLHQLSYLKQVIYLMISEKGKLMYSFQSLLPFLIAGHIYTEIIFSLPGFSRLTFTAIREFDSNVVMCLTGIITFVYSFIYLLTESLNDH